LVDVVGKEQQDVGNPASQVFYVDVVVLSDNLVGGAADARKHV